MYAQFLFHLNFLFSSFVILVVFYYLREDQDYPSTTDPTPNSKYKSKDKLKFKNNNITNVATCNIKLPMELCRRGIYEEKIAHSGGLSEVRKPKENIQITKISNKLLHTRRYNKRTKKNGILN